MNDYEKNILENIDEYGCSVTHVFDPDEDAPGFSYSIGIQKTSNHPEIIISGLERNMMHWMINEYNRRIQNGMVFKEDGLYASFLTGYDVTFKRVDPKHYDEYLRSCQWLYKGNDFEVLQMVWPNQSGHWPWDADAPEDYLKAMDVLY